MEIISKIGLLIGFCIILSADYSIAQKSNSVHIQFQDSLNYYKEKDNLSNYLKFVDSCVIKLINKKNVGDIRKLDSLFVMFRRPSTNEEKKSARRAYGALGFVYGERFKDNTKALEYYLLSHEFLNEERICDEFCWWIENKIGSIYSRQGDYELAIHFYDKVKHHFIEEKDSVKLPRLLVNIGAAYRFLFMRDEAIEEFNNALKYAGTNYNDQLPIHLSFADLYVDELDLANANKHFELALKASQDSRAKRKDHLIRLRGDIESIKGNFEKADKSYEELYDLLKDPEKFALDRDLAKILVKRGYCSLQLNKFEGALEFAKHGFELLLQDSKHHTNNFEIPPLNELQDENTFFDLLDIYAQVYFEEYKKTGNIESLYKAHSANLKCLKLMDRIRHNYYFENSINVKIRLKQKVLDFAFEVAYEVYNVENGNTHIDDDLEYLFGASKSLLLIDNSKSIEHIDTVNSNDVKISKSLKAEIKRLLKEMKEREEVNIRDSLFNLITLKKDTLNSIFEKYQVKPTAENVSYIDYSITDTWVYSYSQMNKNKSFIRHGKTEELTELVKDFNRVFDLRYDLDSTKNVLNSLFEFLLKPLEELDNKFVIIPDGVITFVPFDVLVDDEGKYLIRNKIISYEYHRKFLFAKRERGTDDLNVLAVCPSYGKWSELNDKQIERSERYPLKYAKEELHSLKNYFSEGVKTINTLSKDSLFRSLSTANVFHFAGHAKVNMDSAYLFLSGLNKLDYRDVLLETNNLELVTLSACETGLGYYKYGEGIQSIGRSFLSSGASTIVNSLWTVNDNATSKLIDHFYAEIKKGKSVDESIRNSKLKYLKNVGPESRHPYYWGGLVAYGNMKPIMGSSSPFMYYIILVVIFLLVILSILFKFKSQ